MTTLAQEHGQAFGRIDVVIDDQDALTWPYQPGRNTAVAGYGRRLFLFQHGQADDEFAPLVEAGAVGLDAAAVHFHETAHQRQADAEPPLRMVQRAIDLREEIEDRGNNLSNDDNVLIAYAQQIFVSSVPTVTLATAFVLS